VLLVLFIVFFPKGILVSLLDLRLLAPAVPPRAQTGVA